MYPNISEYDPENPECSCYIERDTNALVECAACEIENERPCPCDGCGADVYPGEYVRVWDPIAEREEILCGACESGAVE